MNRQSGLSLVEVMVALVISTILILGVTDLFNSAFMSSRSNSELARMQDSGRLAMELVGADIRNAGLWTCTTFNWSDTPRLQWKDESQGDSALGYNKSASTITSIDLRFIPSGEDCRSDSAPILKRTYSFANNKLQRTDTLGSGTADTQTLLEGIEGEFVLMPDKTKPAELTAVMIKTKVKSEQNDFSARAFTSVYELKNKLAEQN